MEIRGIIITSTETLRDSFFFPDLWDTLRSGTLYTFEQALSARHDPQGIAQEIAAMLGEHQLESGAALLRDGGLDPEALERRIVSPGGAREDRVILGQNFFRRNADAISTLVQPLREGCNPRQAWELTLFLLLNLQARPRETLEGCEFLSRRLAELRTAPPPVSGVAALPGPRLCLCGEKLLLLREGQIWQRQGGEFSPLLSSDTPVAGFAYTDQLGLIAFDADGRLCGRVHPLLQRLTEGRAVRQVTACLDQFALLAADGTLIVDPRCRLPAQDKWTQLHWLHQGLNSLTGIQGPMRRVIQWGSSQALEEYTNVRSIDTSSRRNAVRYALLCEDGGLFMDDGGTEADVLAACLYSGGYLYVKGRTVYRRSFGSETPAALHTLPEDFLAEELHAGSGIAACGGTCDGIFQVEVMTC